MAKTINDPAAGFSATLVKGESYTLFKARKQFLRGIPVQVTAAEKDYLEEHAVDSVTRSWDDGDGNAVHDVVPKFTFAPFGGDL